MDIYKVCIVGCGSISKKHITSLINLNQKIVGICDFDEGRMNKLAEDMSLAVDFFSDFNEMILETNPEIIIVLTPSGTHAKIVKEIARYKKHIIVEKPISLTVKDADEMINACDNSGSTLTVVKQNRYNLPVKVVRGCFLDGQLGAPFLGTVRVRWSRTQKYYDNDAWRGTWMQDGGVIANQAIHHIDMLQWFFGDVESVFAKNINALLDIEAEDTSVATLKFKNGALGIIEATSATRPKDLEGSISILGSRGSAIIGGFFMNKIDAINLANGKTIKDFKSDISNPPDFAFSHKEFYKDFFTNLTNKKPQLVDGREALKSLQIVHAIYKSNEENREIFLYSDSLISKLGQKDSKKYN